MITEESKNRILEAADIVSVAQALIPDLKKSGTNYTALSPFTEEKSPSFNVIPAKNFWKCFSSDKGGDAIKLVQEIRKETFPEAMKWLAQFTGEELRYLKDERTQESKSKEQKYLQLTTACLQAWQKELYKTKQDPEGPYQYLINRGFTEEDIIKEQFGYAPLDKKFLTAKILNSGSYQQAKELGIIRSPEGATYDAFIHRIIIPMLNGNNQPIAFSGRTMSIEKNENGKLKYPKYINSSNSDLFNKSYEIDGLDVTGRNAIYNLGYAILVEGAMDVRACRQMGAYNTVGTWGTSFTQHHAKKLKHLTKKIYFMLDSDPAGMRATEKSIQTALAEGLYPYIIHLPKGMDPDDLRKNIDKIVQEDVDEETGEITYKGVPTKSLSRRAQPSNA